jgi:hypothetical protein
MKPRCLLPLLLGLSLAATLGTATAKPHRPIGLAKFAARYTGGYTINSATGNTGGQSEIRIRAPKNGSSATMIWKNTFYSPTGSYRVTLQWTFLPGGAMAGNSLDLRGPLGVQSGRYLFSGRTVTFDAASTTAGVTAKGQLSKVGGGAISITVTLTGLPEGEFTYSFSGGRKR